jgi:hypothetical protein
MFKKIVISSVLLIVLLLFFNSKEVIILKKNDIIKIEHGDIILSSGQSMSSFFIKNFDLKKSSFTHIGIIMKKDSFTYIFHAIPNESGQAVRYDLIQDYINSSKVNHIQIYRPLASVNYIELLNQNIKHHSKTKSKFDYGFNNFDKNKIYCSELVYDILCGYKCDCNSINIKKPIHPNLFKRISCLSLVHEISL